MILHLDNQSSLQFIIFLTSLTLATIRNNNKAIPQEWTEKKEHKRRGVDLDKRERKHIEQGGEKEKRRRIVKFQF